MLRKLLKHDIKAVSKFALPMLGGIALATILIGLLIGGVVRFDNPQTTVFAGMTIFLLMLGVFLAIAVLNVLVVVRFYTNLMTDEGYLSFTLPVTATEHICSKLITAVMFMLASGLVAIISAIIATLLAVAMIGNLTIADVFTGFGYFWKGVAYELTVIFNELDLEISAAIILAVLSCIFSLTFQIFSAYFAMTVAGMAKKAKFFIGLAVYFGVTFVVERIIGMVIVFVHMPSSMALMCITVAVQIIGTVALFFLTKNMLTKKLNLN